MLPARYPLLANSATCTTLSPFLRHCLDHPARLRRYESTRSTGPGCLRGTCPSWALQPTRPWLLSSCPTPYMHPEGQYSRCWVARPTSSLQGILVLKSDVSSPPLLSPYFEIGPFSTLETSLLNIKRFFDGDAWFEIWHWSQISTRGDVRAQKKWEKGWKGLTVIRGNSGPTLARGWLQGLKASPLSARPYTMCHIPKSRTTCSTRCNVRTRMKLRGHVKCDIHN